MAGWLYPDSAIVIGWQGTETLYQTPRSKRYFLGRGNAEEDIICSTPGEGIEFLEQGEGIEFLEPDQALQWVWYALEWLGRSPGEVWLGDWRDLAPHLGDIQHGSVEVRYLGRGTKVEFRLVNDIAYGEYTPAHRPSATTYSVDSAPDQATLDRITRGLHQVIPRL